MNLKSVHVYVNPNNNDTGAGHSVSRVTGVRTRRFLLSYYCRFVLTALGESRAADRERKMAARLT